MQLNKFLLINGILFIPFGFFMVIIPNLLFPIFGIHLDEDGTLMAKVFGSALLSIGLICFMCRSANSNATAVKSILWGNLIFHLLDAVSTGMASVNQDMNSLGWLFTVLHLSMALGFLYFILTNKSDQ